MSDLISRQAALDAINHICPIDTEYDCALLDRVDVRCVLSDLPSAEPEQIIKIGQRSGKTLESAIDYLQSTGWLQEHDRILTESAEPELKWIPVTEALPEDKRQVLVYAQSAHFALAKYDEMMEPDGKWKKQWVTFDAWKPFYTIKNVIAWMPLPEPWRGEK